MRLPSTTPLLAVLAGALVAFAIACGGGSSAGKPRAVGGGMPGDPRAEIDRLDAQIAAEMERLGQPQPQPAPGACTEDCPPQAMATAARAAQAEDPACKPAASATCTEACTLKQSICANATRICEIAAQLGGSDRYANDKCNRGTASCEAAKQRCCNCT